MFDWIKLWWIGLGMVGSVMCATGCGEQMPQARTVVAQEPGSSMGEPRVGSGSEEEVATEPETELVVEPEEQTPGEQTPGEQTPGEQMPEEPVVEEPMVEEPPLAPLEPVFCASQEGSSTLDGVRVVFPEQSCRFTLEEAQAGVRFVYELVVQEDVAGVITEVQEAGGCGSFVTSGLEFGIVVSGAQQRYCLCQIGGCGELLREPMVLAAGVYRGEFVWDGVNWNGGGDAPLPKGPAFPPGFYTLTVRTVGSVEGAQGVEAFAVVGTLGFELVAP